MSPAQVEHAALSLTRTIDAKTRRSVKSRSNGWCEAITPVCTGRAVHIHHRKLRRHGDHRACNLLHVCLMCHAEIHANVAISYEAGFLIRSFDDPAEIQIRGAA